ncbi:hypothetical protein HC928_18710 [bacterium]|nr:hypothetical protein [bacterium]
MSSLLALPMTPLTKSSPFIRWVVVLLILLGLSFRVVGLGDRVYWVDEVATSIRVAGYTRAEIVAQLSDAPPRRAADLQQFLQLAPILPGVRRSPP